MSRYIDADALVASIKKLYENMGVDMHGIWNKQLAKIFKDDCVDVDDIRMFLKGIWNSIEDAPSIDIVRCRECGYNYGIMTGQPFNPEDIVCDYWASDGLEADDFCSYGTREIQKI